MQSSDSSVVLLFFGASGGVTEALLLVLKSAHRGRKPPNTPLRRQDADQDLGVVYLIGG